MTQQTFSTDLIIGRDMICFQMIQDFLQNHFILFHTQPAFRTGDDVVRTGSIKSSHRIALFIRSKGKLCFVAVSPRIIHSYDFRLCKIGDASDPDQMVPYLFRFKIKLCFIGHGLQLTSSALAGKCTSWFHPLW